MLPIHSHSSTKRSFSKVKNPPRIVKIILLLVLYVLVFVCGFVGYFKLKTAEINELGVPVRYRMPALSSDASLRDLLSIGGALAGENRLISSPKYVQHLFLEQVRETRATHPELFAYDEQYLRIQPHSSEQQNKHSFVRTLHKPTQQEFLSYVRRCTPIVLTGIVDDWNAYQHWTDEYLTEKIGHVKIPIEVSNSQDFYGDAVRQRVQDLTVADFLREYRKPERTKNYYLAETSILEHFQVLLNDFPRRPYFIPSTWTLDVIQLWIGAGGQITPSHNDEANNILCQFKGGRTFYVYDPFYVDLLYTSAENPVYPRVKVRETTPNYKQYPLFRKAPPPMELRIEEGQCLYLPSTWYHRVESKPDVRSLAINYWYRPPSTLEELLWMTMSSHEWTTSDGELRMGRKRGDE